MTNNDDYDENGLIFNYSPNTGLNTVDHIFLNGNKGDQPQFDKVCEANGKIYGITNYGGMNGNGVLYEYNLSTGAYSVKKDFTYSGSSGYYPEGGLIKASNGKIYGCTSRGGNASNGVLFEFDPSNANYTVKHHFNVGTSGITVRAKLMEGAAGVLYGITSNGGANSRGVLFEYNLNTNTFAAKYNFDSNDGVAASGLMTAANGKFYGISDGSWSHSGKLFEFDPAVSSFTVMYDFGSNLGNGFYPTGVLMQASDTKLYGVTRNGGSSSAGVVFQYDLALSSYTVMHNFNGANGSEPQGELVEASTGKLLGLTRYGGSANGVLFELDFNTTSYTVKHIFTSQDGYEPRSSLFLASNGKYYATTMFSNTNSTFFEYDYTSDTYTKKFTFTSPVNGSNLNGSLTKHTNGKMYGMATNGGTENEGVIFEYNPLTKTQVVKYNFNYLSGYNPYGSLIQGANNLLYGFTYRGGANNSGVVFEFNPTTSTYTVLHSFNYNDGATPYYGKLAQTANGLLYGTTYSGGANDDGVIFKYDLATSSYTVEHHFDYNQGRGPYSGVKIGSNGKLYGTTYSGGTNGEGLIFEFDPTGASSYTILHNFDYMEGANPYGGLTEISNGKFVGATSSGGTDGDGVIFEYDLALSTYTKKYDFDNQNGYRAYGDLYKAADGMLYGVTQYGGFNGSGVLYQYNPTTGAYAKKISFHGENGSSGFGSLIETCETPKPFGTTAQTICENATVANLVAFGTSVKWYNASGTALSNSTALVNGDKYYASQTIGCESETKLEVTYTCTVGMEDATSTTFGVYPNPNNGVFTIVSNNTNTTYAISDITGKLVKQGTISANKTEVNLNEVTTGIYFLKVDNQVSKIVKQ